MKSPAACKCGVLYKDEASQFCRSCGTKRARLGEAAATPSPGVSKCSCGQPFKEDSPFCRKCGKRRADMPAVALATPPPAAKRPKVDPSVVADKVAIVVADMDKAYGRSDACRHMLHNMVPTSLGVPSGDRTDYQKEAAQMIGKALKTTHDALLEEAAKAERLARAAAERLRAADAKKLAADRLLSAQREAEKKRESSDLRADQAVQEANAARDTAKEALQKAQQDFDDAAREKQRIDDLYTKHFLPLKNGSYASRQEALAHLKVLVPEPLASWGGEDCLLAGFEKAAVKQPSERFGMCTKVVEETEKLFLKPRKDADADLKNAKDALDRAARDLKLAQDAADEAARRRASNEAAKEGAVNALKDAEDAANAAEKERQEAEMDAADKKDDADRKKRDVDDHKNGPLAAYEWLLRHDVPGYDPSSCPKAVDSKDARDPEQKGKVADVEKRLVEGEHPEGPTKDMLISMVPGAMGPKPNERDDLQKEGVEMIMRGLGEKITDLEDAIAQILPQVGKTNITAKLVDLIKSDPEKAAQVVDKAVGDKQYELDEAKTRQREACGNGVAKAQKVLDDALASLDEAKRDAESLEDAYTKHFLPLKNGTDPDNVQLHLNVLSLILDQYDVEPCLKAGFMAASCHQPGQRGEWCRKCMDEVERFFAGPRKLAKDKVAGAEAAVRRAETELERAKQACAAAKFVVARLEQELSSLLKLRAWVLQLIDVRAFISSLRGK